MLSQDPFHSSRGIAYLEIDTIDCSSLPLRFRFLQHQPEDLIQSKPKFTIEETSKTMFVVSPTAVEINGTS